MAGVYFTTFQMLNTMFLYVFFAFSGFALEVANYTHLYKACLKKFMTLLFRKGQRGNESGAMNDGWNTLST